jgi:hypothetical protein
MTFLTDNILIGKIATQYVTSIKGFFLSILILSNKIFKQLLG